MKENSLCQGDYSVTDKISQAVIDKDYLSFEEEFEKEMIVKVGSKISKKEDE